MTTEFRPTRRLGYTMASVALLTALTGASAQPEEVIDIGSRRELFVDQFLVHELRGVRLKLHPPVRADVAFEFDQPWEGASSTYVTVFRDSDKYRAYYRGSDHGDEKRSGEFTCYAESQDGVHWTKPAVGLFEFRGSKQNNIVWSGDLAAHNFAPFKDSNPNAPPEHQYKAVGGKKAGGGVGLYAFVSPDGIHWKKLAQEPVITDGSLDSQNIAFWDKQRNSYVAYFRDSRRLPQSEGGAAQSVRAVKLATSSDFLKWTPGTWLDYGDSVAHHLYTNTVTPYTRAPHIYLSFPMRFIPGRRALPQWEKWYPFGPSPGTSDSLFMTSRDGLRWERTFLEAYLRPGLDIYNWSDRNMMIASGVVETGPEELSIYWIEHYKHRSNRLVRGTVRPDGFISVNGPSGGGELVTKTFQFSGSKLRINYSTSAAGSIRIEVQGPAGKPVAGFAMADAEEIFGDGLDRVVTWRGDADLATLSGRPVRLRIHLTDADLYSFQFGQQD